MNATQMLLIAAVMTGTLGMWFLLPRGGLHHGAAGRMLGALLAAVAAGLFLARVPRLADWTADAIFLILAGATLIPAAATVTVRNPVYAAIWFGLTLVGTAGLFLFQGAQFLAVATIVVYAGAILVTFLFLLMLAQPRGRAAYDRVGWEPLLSAAAGAVLVGVLSLAAGSLAVRGAASGPTETDRAAGVLVTDHVAALGGELFGRHLIAVEAAGVLLLAALVGAAVIVAQTKRPPAMVATEPNDSAALGGLSPTTRDVGPEREAPPGPR